jgi:hypothetical protein
MLLQVIQAQSPQRQANKGMMHVQTVHGNYEGYTKREVEQESNEARKAQVMVGNPSKKDFKGMVSNRLITNCPIAYTNVTKARWIFGLDLASIRGKTVWWVPEPVVVDYVAALRMLMEGIKIVTLAVDVFFVNDTASLLKLSHKIKFVMAKHVPVRTATSLSKHLNQVIQVYCQAGFVVRMLLMDREIEKIKDLMPMVECNTTAAKKHVSEAEQMIRVVKECVRGLIGTLHFDHIPWQMKIKFIYFFVLWLNAFPVQKGISAVHLHLPQELLVRWKMDYRKHCQVLPGTYCKVNNEPLPSNSMTSQTHEAIAIGPTGNLQGSVKFYCVNTGRILKQRSFTPLPIPGWIIWRVNAIGLCKQQGQSFCFLNRHKEPYEWTDDVPEDNPKFLGLLDKEEEAPHPDISAKLPGPKLEFNEVKEVVTPDPTPEFEELAAHALDNAGSDLQEWLHAAQLREDILRGPAVVDTNNQHHKLNNFWPAQSRTGRQCGPTQQYGTGSSCPPGARGSTQW